MDDLFVTESIPYRNGAVIKVVGVGGAGGNAVANMIAANIENVEFISVNTDSRALMANTAPTKILLGKSGLGAGCNPEVGRTSAIECIEDIRGVLRGADMVFITCGMGGGTGTGAAPVVAAEAKSAGALTVAVVYMPCTTDGVKKNEIAKNGLEELVQYVDSYIVVPNDGMQDAGHTLNFFQSLKMADDVLRQSVQGISEMATGCGYINIDFADVRTAMSERGKSVMGIGVAKGENRARQAFENALKSPLLADTSIMGAYFVLVNISCNMDDFTQDEYAEIGNLVYEQAGPEAQPKIGVKCDDRSDGSLSVTIVATGISGMKKKRENIAHINEAKKTRPGAGAQEIPAKLKGIARQDKNLLNLDNLNEDIFEIPTYLRKQAD